MNNFISIYLKKQNEGREYFDIEILIIMELL